MGFQGRRVLHTPRVTPNDAVHQGKAISVNPDTSSSSVLDKFGTTGTTPQAIDGNAKKKRVMFPQFVSKTTTEEAKTCASLFYWSVRE